MSFINSLIKEQSGGYKEKLRAYSYKSDYMDNTQKTPAMQGSTTKSKNMEEVWNLLSALQQEISAIKDGQHTNEGNKHVGQFDQAESSELQPSVKNRLDNLEKLASENELKIKVLSNVIIRQEEHKLT